MPPNLKLRIRSRPEHTFKLGHGSLLDQVARDMRGHNEGKSPSPEAVRAQLAAIAKANKWPGSEAQWTLMSKTARLNICPNNLNSHLRSGMDISVPNNNRKGPLIAVNATERPWLQSIWSLLSHQETTGAARIAKWLSFGLKLTIRLDLVKSKGKMMIWPAC